MNAFRSSAALILAAGVMSGAGIGAALRLTEGGTSPLSQAAAETSPQETVEQQKRLAAIKADIDRLRLQIAEEGKKEKTALSLLDRIGFNKRLIRNELRLLQMQLDQLKIERERIRKDIPALEADLSRRRADLGRILVTLYKYGRLGSARLALAARDAASFLAESQALILLAAAQDRRIAEYADNLTALGLADERLKAKEIEIGALIRTAAGKQRDFDAEEKKGQALVDQIKTNRKTYEQTLDELSLRARELQQLLQKLDAREKPDVLLPFPSIPFASKKGQLPWPVNGRVIQGFGVQRGSFNTSTMNNGIEIAPPADDLTVRALHGGKIVYADHFPGYGNLIILEHGETYYTLYGHCAEFLAKKEDPVKAGDPIAVAGDTGSLVGVSLYLEIRHQTKPLNPLQWLSRR
jgi:septal ring factor EnvC (AmiA/AmiB activator)